MPLVIGFDLRHARFVRFGHLPGHFAISGFQRFQRVGVALFDPLLLGAKPLLIFLRNARGLFREAHRLVAAPDTDAFHGLAPFGVERALGFLKLIFDPRLLSLQMDCGFLDARIEHPAPLRKIAGDGRGQR